MISIIQLVILMTAFYAIVRIIFSFLIDYLCKDQNALLILARGSILKIR